MKKLILLTAFLLSVVFGKSVEQLQSEWSEKHNAIAQKQIETFQQSDEFKRLTPHCQSGDKGACRKLLVLQNKHCKNGFALHCASFAQLYLQGNEEMGIKIDENKAISYANKACKLDKTICASISGLFYNKSRKIALKYAEQSCEMGEMLACLSALEFYAVGFGGIGKNPQKVKYYSDKLCKVGVKEACE